MEWLYVSRLDLACIRAVYISPFYVYLTQRIQLTLLLRVTAAAHDMLLPTAVTAASVLDSAAAVNAQRCEMLGCCLACE